MGKWKELYHDDDYPSITQEEAKMELYLSILEEMTEPYQMNDIEYEASIQHIKGELCGQLLKDVLIDESINLSNGQLNDILKLRKRSSNK